MAYTKVSSEVLLQLSSLLKRDREDILMVKTNMDSQLKSFIWDDPVGRTFIARYYEELKPIEVKLIPNMESYCKYLEQMIEKISDFSNY